MTDCELIGIAGGCGVQCQLFLDGECEAGIAISTIEDNYGQEIDDPDMFELYTQYKNVEERERILEVKNKRIGARDYTGLTADDLYAYYINRNNFITGTINWRLIEWFFILQEDNMFEPLSRLIRVKISKIYLQYYDLLVETITCSLSDESIKYLTHILTFWNRESDRIAEYTRVFLKADIDITKFIEDTDIDFDSMMNNTGEPIDITRWPRYRLIELIVHHRNFKRSDIKIFLYKKTDDTKFLGENIADIFIF